MEAREDNLGDASGPSWGYRGRKTRTVSGFKGLISTKRNLNDAVRVLRDSQKNASYVESCNPQLIPNLVHRGDGSSFIHGPTSSSKGKVS